jgi:hypothetical protein
VVTLDAKIDELYQLPPGDFTAARNALAKSLSGDAAKTVKRLAKPAVVPAAINQLYWRARAVYDRLLKTGVALRAAQIAALEGRKTDVRKAADAHRQALAEAVERAGALAARHGARPDPDTLSRMLEALSLAAEPPPDAGRFTGVLKPAGFEALTGVTPAALGRASETRTAQQNRTRQIEEARKVREERIAAAERSLDQARADEAEARRALERAEREVRKAADALARLAEE